MALLINKNFNLDYDFANLFNEVITITLSKLNIKKDFDLSVSFIDDQEIKAINNEYRNINKKTDVISFAMLDSPDMVQHDESQLDLGDIFISVETAKQQAISLNQSLEEEILFLFIHGLLHLLGYDHQETKDEKIMFKLQEEILNEINKKNYF